MRRQCSLEEEWDTERDGEEQSRREEFKFKVLLSVDYRAQMMVLFFKGGKVFCEIRGTNRV